MIGGGTLKQKTQPEAPSRPMVGLQGAPLHVGVPCLKMLLARCICLCCLLR